MAELKIIGQGTDQIITMPVDSGEAIRIGRSPQSGNPIPWDQKISREHADVVYQDGNLSVKALETARNPIILNGAAAQDFSVKPGEPFFIGDTKFELIDQLSSLIDDELDDLTMDKDIIVNRSYTAESLKSIQFNDIEQRLEFLCQLPQVIADSASDEDFAVRIVEFLHEKNPRCYGAAVVQFEVEEDKTLGQPKLIRCSSRDEVARFMPSNRLMQEAITRGETVAHLWLQNRNDGESQMYTLQGEMDWAFCVPILGEASYGWCLYVAGKRRMDEGIASDEDLKPDMRYTEVISEFVSAIRKVRLLEQQHTKISQCFSPKIIQTLTDPNAILAPKEGNVSILFCDIRGFSKKVENSKHDLHGLLLRVKEALGMMTRSILDNEGSIADFQGDAALAFWGWPHETDDGAFGACQAALRICKFFNEAQNDPAHTLFGFKFGIGVGFGNAIAGNIGSHEMTKIGVFGPVVNTTARLETMTKQLGVQILVDEPTAYFLRNRLSPEDGRLRTIARIRPVGIAESVLATEVLLPEELDNSVSSKDIENYEMAWRAIEAGQWDTGKKLLDSLPQDDGPTLFLQDFIAENNSVAPRDWDGTIQLKKK